VKMSDQIWLNRRHDITTRSICLATLERKSFEIQVTQRADRLVVESSLRATCTKPRAPARRGSTQQKVSARRPSRAELQSRKPAGFLVRSFAKRCSDLSRDERSLLTLPISPKMTRFDIAKSAGMMACSWHRTRAATSIVSNSIQLCVAALGATAFKFQVKQQDTGISQASGPSQKQFRNRPMQRCHANTGGLDSRFEYGGTKEFPDHEGPT
jgi:hypothetical protein